MRDDSHPESNSRAILHIDMDAFYASVEQRDDPRLQGRPVIVGGHPRRGVVLAASYEVRPFGVRSAMPMSRALQLAPDAIVVPPRGDAYAEASEQVHAIFESVTPLIEPLSLDEAFLDVTHSISMLGAPAVIARTIRERIAREVRLPASAGIASVKFAAKIASDLAKPNGQMEVPAEQTAAFLRPLPVSRLWGVGPKTEKTLLDAGLRTIGDVADRTPADLERALGPLGLHLWELGHGIDSRPVVPDRDAKSIGAEDTFENDRVGPDALRPAVHSQALRVGRRLRRAGVMARVVVLKLKFSDFRLITRRVTLPEPTDDSQALYRAVEALLVAERLERAVRLTGVSAQDLSTGRAQLGLFEAAGQRARKLNATLDKIAARYGGDAVLPADVSGREPAGNDEARRLIGAARFDTSRVLNPAPRRKRD